MRGENLGSTKPVTSSFLLEEQDRSRWNQQQIVESLPLVTESLRNSPGPYGLQAASRPSIARPFALKIRTGLRFFGSTTFSIARNLHPSSR